MNILMLAPEPFFQPRGTPISVYFRLKALSHLGHHVDVVTYHVGENVKFKNVNIFRIPDLGFIKEVKIGPSFGKIPLDFLLWARAFFRLVHKRYDLIFSHEEAALLGVWLSQIGNLPHVYDMHSSLPQQLENYDFSRSQILHSLFRRMEKYILKHSQAVIAICDDLREKVERQGFGSKVLLLENFLEFESPTYTPSQIKEKRSEIAPPHHKIILYAGNFQPYQGIPLLLEALSGLKEKKIVLLLAGGTPREINNMKKKAASLSISNKVRWVGQIPPSQMSLFIALADVLVSPRISGTNTPLKIYSFLKSGKPVVATNLWTHTQVLNPQISILVNPDPSRLAEGLDFALFHPQAQKRAQQAKKLGEQKYNLSLYIKTISQILNKALESKKHS